MKTTIEIELRPFGVPNRVQAVEREYQPHESPYFDLNQIDAETLSKMCDEFRLTIFNLARKSDPKVTVAPYDDRDHP